MRPEVVRHLRCPVCGDPLRVLVTPRGPLTCRRGHSFDQARQGYAQLTAAPLVHTGDNAEMVAARAAFLGAGHYAPITSALSQLASAGWPGGLVLDLGAGTGHHLAGVLDGLPSDAYGLAADASRPAVRAAARAHPRADAIVCDAWQPLPLSDDSIGVALNVFAPRPGAELARVLSPDGVLLVVTPTGEHLNELVEPLSLLRVDPAKPDRVSNALEGALTRADTIAIHATMTLSHAEVTTLVGMGPSAWHAGAAARARAIAALPDPTLVTLSATLATYRPLGSRRHGTSK